MAAKKALLLGASGLTGRYLLKLLLQDDAYGEVTVYARRHLKTESKKMIEKIVDFEQLDTAVEADDVFCCLDNTVEDAGSEKAFKQTNLEFPLKVAKLQKKAGSKIFLVISSMKADVSSDKLYNQVKGKMEEDIKAIGFPSLYIFRPSTITGSRKEKNAPKNFTAGLLKMISPVLVGPLQKYKPISAKAIGSAMIYYANKKETGTSTILSNEIKEFEL